VVSGEERKGGLVVAIEKRLPSRTDPEEKETVARLRRALRRFKRNRLAIAGALIVSIAVLTGLLAPFLPLANPDLPDVEYILAAPSSQHWLGTDSLGRDTFSRIVHGARISLLVGVAAVSISMTVGVTLGALAGYYGGWIDVAVSRLIDVFLAIPSILLAIAIMAVLPPGVFSIILAIALTDWTRFARVTRGETMALKVRDFVEGARAMGATDLRILLMHVMRNTLAPLIVISTFSVATAILVEASLSFLGLGVPPPTPTWGAMLADAKPFMRDAPWASIFPGLAIMFVILGFNFLGDGVRDASDPHLRI
jgi:peptide/nickel transport system permease protein